jgi:magnesium chelatase subunit ChlD-like protein
VQTLAIDWLATLLQGPPERRADVQYRARRSVGPELCLILLDASASTRRGGALAKAKGLLAELFERAYRARVRIALLDAHGAQPCWQWQGHKAGAVVQQWLAGLGSGGGSPLIAAVQEAQVWLRQRQRRRPSERQRLLIITDGRLRPWPPLAGSPCPTSLVDIESVPVRLGRAVQLARELDAHYQHIDHLPRHRAGGKRLF